MKHLKTNGGFSLVELLVALTILAVGMLGVLGMQVFAIRGNAFASNMTVAENIARQKIEYYNNVSYGTIRTVNPSPLPSVKVAGFTNTVVYGQTNVATTTLPVEDRIAVSAIGNDVDGVDIEGYGMLRADWNNTVFEDRLNNVTKAAVPDGIPDPPFDKFRRVTIFKVIDGEYTVTGSMYSDCTIVIKVLVFWRGPEGAEHKVVMMTMKNLGG